MITIMKRTYLIIFTAAIIGVLAGLGTSEVFLENANQRDTGHDYFITQGVLHANVYTFGFNTNSDIDHSMRIRTLGYPARVRENFVKTDAMMADIWYPEMGKLLEDKPETRILPYRVNPRDELFGFYVKNDSEIDSPEDLDNKTVMLTNLPVKPEVLSVGILEEEYDVDVKITDETHRGPSIAE